MIHWPSWFHERDQAHVFHFTSYFIRTRVSKLIPLAGTQRDKLRLVLRCGLFALCVFLKRVHVRIRRGEEIPFEEIRMAATGRLMRELIDEVRKQIAAKWRGFESVNPVEDIWSLSREAREALPGLPMQGSVNRLLEKIASSLDVQAQTTAPRRQPAVRRRRGRSKTFEETPRSRLVEETLVELGALPDIKNVAKYQLARVLRITREKLNDFERSELPLKPGQKAAISEQECQEIERQLKDRAHLAQAVTEARQAHRSVQSAASPRRESRVPAAGHKTTNR